MKCYDTKTILKTNIYLVDLTDYRYSLWTHHWLPSILYYYPFTVIFHQSCLAHKHHLKWIAYWKDNKKYPKRKDKTSSTCWLPVINKYDVLLNGTAAVSVETWREGVPDDVTFRELHPNLERDFSYIVSRVYNTQIMCFLTVIWGKWKCL